MHRYISSLLTNSAYEPCTPEPARHRDLTYVICNISAPGRVACYITWLRCALAIPRNLMKACQSGSSPPIKPQQSGRTERGQRACLILICHGPDVHARSCDALLVLLCVASGRIPDLPSVCLLQLICCVLLQMQETQ